ncbi:unnamed protein product [Nezara viridula]|uniref:Carboxylic ester hydrolase n=1 Tax=Nezara viridula TaxID=85310 RepID=A0A9P0HR10_NEZVI|nr:unnamed protein product [Nezara viridula]
MLAAVLCVAALGHLVLGESPQVITSYGTMKGQVLKSRDGREFSSFTRIPYAKPPVGERRFMISEKADNWTGILDATQPIPSCYQTLFPFGQGAAGQEDCLYLNIFTPNVTGRLPVIFNIHGGAFKQGSAGGLDYANFFMDEDVVFVSTNYRLGTMGFLSLEDDVIPGNMGLKDQALALEWVYQEISAFGGDPNLITVIGGSAGAVSAHLICEVPRTNGLLKGCISQSGDGWAHWAILEPGSARKMALKMAKKVGCNETGDLLRCLQSKPIELIGDVNLLQNNSQALTLVSPVLEPANAPGAILTSWPTKVNHHHPRILGLVQDEGMVYTLFYEFHLVSDEEKENFINGFNQTIISGLHLEKRTRDFLRIRERFFTKGVDPLLAIRNFVTEYMWVYPALKSLSTHTGPTYFYKFNYTQGPPFPFGHPPDHPGVPHGAEGAYFFPGNTSTGWPKPEDIKLSKMLIKMWVNFARNQNPSSPEMVQWPQFQGQNFLDIQDSGVTVGNYTQYQEILDFWQSIFPDQPSSSSTIQSSLLFIATLCIITTLKGLFA